MHRPDFREAGCRVTPAIGWHLCVGLVHGSLRLQVCTCKPCGFPIGEGLLQIPEFWTEPSTVVFFPHDCCVPGKRSETRSHILSEDKRFSVNAKPFPSLRPSSGASDRGPLSCRCHVHLIPFKMPQASILNPCDNPKCPQTVPKCFLGCGVMALLRITVQEGGLSIYQELKSLNTDLVGGRQDEQTFWDTGECGAPCNSLLISEWVHRTGASQS